MKAGKSLIIDDTEEHSGSYFYSTCKKKKISEVFLLYGKVLFSPVLLKKVMAAAVGADSPHAFFLHMNKNCEDVRA